VSEGSSSFVPRYEYGPSGLPGSQREAAARNVLPRFDVSLRSSSRSFSSKFFGLPVFAWIVRPGFSLRSDRGK